MVDGPFAIPVHDVALHQVFAHQALVGWQDAQLGVYQHLGRLSDAEDAKAKLTLCGDRAVGHVLLHFHLPLKARPSQPKSVKHMHLIIPIEGLRVDMELITVRDADPRTKPQLLRDGMTPETLLVHVRLKLGQAAFAVMPLGSRPVQTQLSNKPAQLLQHLRSLTQTEIVDVFLKFGTVSTHMEEIRKDLKQERLQVPQVNLDAMYGRGVRGAINIWDNYVCDERDLPTAAWNPLLDNDPPSYNEVVAMKQNEPTNTDALPIDRFILPAMTMNGLDGEIRVRCPQYWFRTPDPMPVPPVARSAKLQALQYRMYGTGGSTTEEDPSPLRIRLTNPVVADAISATCEAKNILRSRRGEGSDWLLLQKPQLVLELQEWLDRAWRHDPQAHHTYLADLSILGRCTRDSDVPGFDAAMSACQARLFTAVSSALSPSSTPMSADLLEQVDLLRAWMNKNVCRNAGTIMMGVFIRLAACARETMDAECVDVTMEDFSAKKAACVAAAFYTFGGR